MARIVGQKTIARALTLDGRAVIVHEIQTDSPLSGAKDNKHFSVDVAGNASYPAGTYGFVSRKDAIRFLTAFENENFKGHDLNGTEIVNVRRGLGIPEMMIAEYGKDEPSRRVPIKTEGEPSALQAKAPSPDEADTKPSTQSRPGPAIETVSTGHVETSVALDNQTDPAADDNPNTTPVGDNRIATAAVTADNVSGAPKSGKSRNQ